MLFCLVVIGVRNPRHWSICSHGHKLCQFFVDTWVIIAFQQTKSLFRSSGWSNRIFVSTCMFVDRLLFDMNVRRSGKVLHRGAYYRPHLVKKSAAWQSPPMRGNIWTTFGWSPLRDEVLRWGAIFGPHLVEVHCETKSSDEGQYLDHIWSKSAVW